MLGLKYREIPSSKKEGPLARPEVMILHLFYLMHADWRVIA
jgi:hypothetical protein